MAKEKELTRLRDALNTERRQLPMVEIEKDYVFEGPDGEASLADLFGPAGSWCCSTSCSTRRGTTAARAARPARTSCPPGCSRHLRGQRHGASPPSPRAPQAKIAAYKARKGWDFPWYSSYGSDFNYDFHVTHRRVGRAR